MEQLDYSLLYRGFVGLGVDEPVVFTKNRERLLEAEVAHNPLARPNPAPQPSLAGIAESYSLTVVS
jgi:hypothetical protein